MFTSNQLVIRISLAHPQSDKSMKMPHVGSAAEPSVIDDFHSYKPPFVDDVPIFSHMFPYVPIFSYVFPLFFPDRTIKQPPFMAYIRLFSASSSTALQLDAKPILEEGVRGT